MSYEIAGNALGAQFQLPTAPSVVTVPVPVNTVADLSAGDSLQPDLGGNGQHRPPPSRADSEALFQSLFLELSADPSIQNEGPDYANKLYEEMKALIAVDPSAER